MKITEPIKDIYNAFSMKGMNAIVTGGSRGIGFGISKAFAQSGANVAIFCRNAERGEVSAQELRQYGTDIRVYACDITDLENCKEAVTAVFRDFGTIDVLVNDAGIVEAAKLHEDDNLSAWHKTMDTDLNGAVHMIHATAPYMIDAGFGRIINITSIAGEDVRSSMNNPRPGYHVAKAALNHLTTYLAMEYSGLGITVNAIAPGLTHSDLDQFLPPEMQVFVDTKLPTRRWTEPIEIGAACVYLASPAGAQVNGVLLTVDAGKRIVD